MFKAVKTNLYFLCLLALSSFPLMGNDITFAYIEQYKTIVINEMTRTGIPASIKMAQAILESGSGKSTLAKQSNNHFGIKCGKNWKGKEVYRHDDDYKNGLLIRSCFRAFDDAEDSFIAHSDFLSNPHSKRYKFLFDYDGTDYTSWAFGLRKAGYATDPNYPQKLIKIIEKYKLYLLDYESTVTPIVEVRIEDQNPPRDDKTTLQSPITIKSIPIKSTESRFKLNKGFYTFRLNDKMTDIASHFNMDVKELYFRNRLPYGVLPLAGERLAIRSYIHLKSTPEYHKSSIQSAGQNYLFSEIITISSL